MIILIDDTLQDLYLDLKKKGYRVHTLSEGIGGDVVIYSGRNISLASVRCIYSTERAFLIDADSAPPQQIERMISDRSYTPLF